VGFCLDRRFLTSPLMLCSSRRTDGPAMRMSPEERGPS
jgi:hypothetical protein